MLKAYSEAIVVMGIVKISRVINLKMGKRVPTTFHQPRTSKYLFSSRGRGSSSKYLSNSFFALARPIVKITCSLDTWSNEHETFTTDQAYND